MKRKALEMLKANLKTTYGRYFTEETNQWIYDLYGEDPFIMFKEIPDFELADLNLSASEQDFENCKIVYEKLKFLSESQASDERLWAGLTHGTFYEYVRKRWGYTFGKKVRTPEQEAETLKSRFFFKSPGRSGIYRNTLSKFWWVGHNTYDSNNTNNHFEKLDIIGFVDISTKINEYFYNFPFSANQKIMGAVFESVRGFNDKGLILDAKKHIRPAMSSLNAIGGSVILDCLSQREITSIFTNEIERIQSGSASAIAISRDLDEDNITDVEEEYGTDGSVEVFLGCTIDIINDNGVKKTYKYDKINGVLPELLDYFTSKKLGDSVEIDDATWLIEKIYF